MVQTFILRQAQDERICGFDKVYPKGHTRANGSVENRSRSRARQGRALRHSSGHLPWREGMKGRG